MYIVYKGGIKVVVIVVIVDSPLCHKDLRQKVSWTVLCPSWTLFQKRERKSL